MKPARKLSRRSFFGQVVGGAFATGALGIVNGVAFVRRARAQPDTDRFDSSPGSLFADSSDRQARQPQQPSGQGPPYTGLTDNDAGSNADNAGYGRQGRGTTQPEQPSGQGPPYTGITDSDSGSYSDNAGYGRGPGGNRSRPSTPRTGVTDGDAGDLPDYGRGGYTGISDNDRGPNADASGSGRGPSYTGRTDSDSNDLGGYGRQRQSTIRPNRLRRDGRCVTYTGQTDGDEGASSDPVEYGNGGRQGLNSYPAFANGSCG